MGSGAALGGGAAGWRQPSICSQPARPSGSSWPPAGLGWVAAFPVFSSCCHDTGLRLVTVPLGCHAPF